MASLFGFIIGTVVTYLLATLILILPGWLLTRRLSKNLRVLLRAGVMAIAFAPGLFISPAGEYDTIAPTVLIIIFYWSNASFWIELAVAPILITFTVCLVLMLWLDKEQGEGVGASIQSIRPAFNWRLFTCLCVLIVLSACLLVPYNYTWLDFLSTRPSRSLLNTLGNLLDVPETLVTCLFAGIGLLLATRIGLGVPILASCLEHHSTQGQLRKLWKPSILIGILCGAIVAGFSHFVLEPFEQAELTRLGRELPTVPDVPVWQGCLALVSGAITQEVKGRLFLLSVVAWIGFRLSGRQEGQPSRAILWTANVVSAICIGASMLPPSTLIRIEPSLAVMPIAQAAMAVVIGLPYGWLFWTYGLESAILASFSAGLVGLVGDLLLTAR